MNRFSIRPQNISTPDVLEGNPAAAALVAAGAFSMPSGSGSIGTHAVVVPAEGGNKSNRVKYHCVSCETNLWGKPGLKIGCLDCEEPFIVA